MKFKLSIKNIFFFVIMSEILLLLTLVGSMEVILGFMYDNGYGVSQDYSEAAKWYSKAAERSAPDAQLALGFKYYLGQGVPNDYVLACMWANLAAAQNNQDAIKVRDEIEKYMTQEQIVEGRSRAHEWMEQHSKSIFQTLFPLTSPPYP